VIYFPDIGVGILAVVVSFVSKPSTRIVRFTAVPCPDPSRN